LISARNHRAELEKVEAQLTALRTDQASIQLLQEQLAELREAKVVLETQSSIKDQRIFRLEEQFATIQNEKDTAMEKAQQLEADLTQRPPLDDDLVEKLRTQLRETQEKLHATEESETSLRADIEPLNENLRAVEEEMLSLMEEKGRIEQEVCTFVWKTLKYFITMRSRLKLCARQTLMLHHRLRKSLKSRHCSSTHMPKSFD
jgi:chromosome segregation ATPase